MTENKAKQNAEISKYPRLVGQLQKVLIYAYWDFQKKEERKREQTFDTVMTENFSKIQSDTKPQI